jgi:hypothetical protein
LPSSSIEILEVISAIPLATMEPEATSPHHTIDVEEDSPLQQSMGSPSYHNVANRYPEDSASEAEDAMEGEAAEEVAVDEDVVYDGRSDA